MLDIIWSDVDPSRPRGPRVANDNQALFARGCSLGRLMALIDNDECSRRPELPIADHKVCHISFWPNELWALSSRSWRIPHCSIPLLHPCNPLACVFRKLLQAVIGFPQYLNHHEKHGSPAPTEGLLRIHQRTPMRDCRSPGSCFAPSATPTRSLQD